MPENTIDPNVTLQHRTRDFALRVIRLSNALPDDRIGWVIGKQIWRSGTSIGANYRSACRSRSDKDVLARMGIAEEEADETMYWFELLMEAEILPRNRLNDVYKETEEILNMIAASIITVKKRLAENS
jgi:four helix bundle protein